MSNLLRLLKKMEKKFKKELKVLKPLMTLKKETLTRRKVLKRATKSLLSLPTMKISLWPCARCQTLLGSQT
jgi:hypothetical protein